MTKIALFGDIHFGPLSRSTDFSVPGEPPTDKTDGGKSLKAELIKVLSEQPIDHLLVAGDLTSTGSPLEFDLCQQALVEIARACPK